MEQNHIYNIVSICRNILYDNPNIFYISEAFFALAKSYNISDDNDIETYVKLSLESRSGLRSIVISKLYKMEDFRWFLPNNLIGDIKIILIESILFEYLSSYITDKVDLKKIIKKYV